ncbi:hypothetical protein FB567DRAFT_104716 [Paraphoma chrysanthemicola]|uniref:F-box domain-containing protein n=1 Tax=Paraphoma chrysanthemicola TaxID=798071 RepID=A0A8K0VWT0_9PLEO|nr:hypothetical protein FB567DRAFT_104716 [Paraphoma chrysanthemicola]
MTSFIERLPVEVFEILAIDLDLSGYQNLRLTSRQLHLLTLSTFGKRFISRLTSTLGSPSLDRLVNLSNHPYFCDVVTRLDIRLLTHRDYKLLANIAKVGIFPPPKRFPVVFVRHEHIRGESTLYDDVLSRKYPQCITERLTRALIGFGNLKTIRFRTQNKEPAGWLSDLPDGDQTFRTKCFQAVIDSILKSEIQLEEFGMSKRKRTKGISKSLHLHYPALQIPFSAHALLRQCFRDLSSLDLSVVTSHNGSVRVPGWENGLSHFIMCAPSLKSLALSLGRDEHISDYSAAIIHSLALSCHLPSLECLHLVNTALHEGDMMAILTRHRGSIRELILKNTRMLMGTWISFLTSLKEVEGLQCLRLALLEGLRSPVVFRKSKKAKPKITLDLAKSERPMREMLEDLVAAESGESGVLSVDVDGWLH